ncbi:MAG: peptidylprolyl isomerase [Alphaproteobacteria bacterium]|nr:peptidylprolyl isomerase [Alphaproteobacteria bacterium]
MRFFLLVAFLTALAFPTAQAAESQRIAAVVNEDAISDFDLEARMRLIAYTANLRGSQEILRRMMPEILRALIDEKLKIQEAARLEITIDDEEMEAAKRRIESRNGIPDGSLNDTLATEGIPASTVTSQIRAALAWEKIVRRRLYPRINVSKDEVDEQMVRLQQFEGAPEYLVSEIFLEVENQDHEDAAYQTIKRASDEARADLKAPESEVEPKFLRLARQFSQGVTALSGGDLGWVRQGQLKPAVDQALPQMEVGAISDPIRSEEGYHVLWLRDRRKIGETGEMDTISLSQILFPLPPNAGPNDVDAAMTRARNEGASVSGCVAMNRLAEVLGTPMSGNLGTVEIGQLTPKLRDAVKDLPIGVASEPIQSEAGVHLMMVCDRPDVTSPVNDRHQVQLNLTMEKLDLLSRRYLRDLRRTAFVDIRL